VAEFDFPDVSTLRPFPTRSMGRYPGNPATVNLLGEVTTFNTALFDRVVRKNPAQSARAVEGHEARRT
jgi:hypothetical protein